VLAEKFFWNPLIGNFRKMNFTYKILFKSDNRQMSRPNPSQAWWHIPLILATREAEMGWIAIWGQHCGKGPWDPISTNEPGVVANVCNSSYMGGHTRRITVPGQPEQDVRSYLRNTWKAKKRLGACLNW
jgi:hypothetical protein